jgi:hypothetical protein
MTEDQLLLLEGLVDEDEWQEWEKMSQKYNVSLGYYLVEFT